MGSPCNGCGWCCAGETVWRRSAVHPRPSGRRAMPRPRMDRRQLRVRHDPQAKPLHAVAERLGRQGARRHDRGRARRGKGMLCRRPLTSSQRIRTRCAPFPRVSRGSRKTPGRGRCHRARLSAGQQGGLDGAGLLSDARVFQDWCARFGSGPCLPVPRRLRASSSMSRSGAVSLHHRAAPRGDPLRAQAGEAAGSDRR